MSDNRPQILAVQAAAEIGIGLSFGSDNTHALASEISDLLTALQNIADGDCPSCGCEKYARQVLGKSNWKYSPDVPEVPF